MPTSAPAPSTSAPAMVTLADGSPLGTVQLTGTGPSRGWYGTLDGGRYLKSSFGPAKTLRALTKHMERAAADPRYARKDPPMTAAPLAPSAAPEPAARLRVRTPAKIVAMARLVKLQNLTMQVVGRLAGFAPELDEAVGQALLAVETARAVLGALPDDVRQKRGRAAPHGKTEVTVGAAYAVKDRYRKQYEATAGGDASLAVVEQVLDEGTVVVVFLNDARAALKKSHLGALVEA